MTQAKTKGRQNRRLIALFDIALIIIIAVVSVLFLMCQLNNNSKLSAVVRVNGDIRYTVAVEDIEKPFDKTFSGQLPVTISFSNTGVFVKSSDCPDKLCMHSKAISHSGQSIVCLPAQVSVTLESQNNDLDAVVG